MKKTTMTKTHSSKESSLFSAASARAAHSSAWATSAWTWFWTEGKGTQWKREWTKASKDWTWKKWWR